MIGDSPPESLTGVWDGLYSYPGVFEPVAFTATLLQAGDSVTGTTHEVADMGSAAGRLIHAALDGRRLSDHVVFLKTYDDLAPDNEYNAQVIYEGVISDDDLEISGSWRIVNVWSGKFLMVRAGRKAVAARQAAFARV